MANEMKEFKSSMPQWAFFQKKKSEQMNTSNPKLYKNKTYLLPFYKELLASTKLVEMQTVCKQSIEETQNSREERYNAKCTLNLEEFKKRYLMYFDTFAFTIIVGLIEKFEERKKKKENSQEEEKNLTLTTDPNEQNFKSKNKGKCILL